jgi:hypothetical protein
MGRIHIDMTGMVVSKAEDGIISMMAMVKISNKSFINSPVKEKAKTFNLSFGRISESDGISRCQGLLTKHDIRSRDVGT